VLGEYPLGAQLFKLLFSDVGHFPLPLEYKNLLPGSFADTVCPAFQSFETQHGYQTPKPYVQALYALVTED